MIKLNTNLIKTFSIVVVLFLLSRYFPVGPIDPWSILNPKKIFQLIFALVILQVLAEVLIWLLGAKAGTIVAGFLGGLISSTALTASLSKKSKLSPAPNISISALTFLSGTLAMLCEAIVMTFVGTDQFHWEILVLFSGPMSLTGFLIWLWSKNRIILVDTSKEKLAVEFLPVLKLTVFIVSILGLAKILQIYFGRNGLFVLTFLVSLFEIHGSIIANIQLHDANSISLNFLGVLLGVSVAASYVSKLFLVTTIGSKELTKLVRKWTALIAVSLLASWIVFTFLT